MKQSNKTITIKGRKIGVGYPTYIIAEMSANHGQNIKEAIRIIDAAKESGADAVKLQTYTPDTITIDCDNEYFTIKDTIWKGRKLYELYAEAFTPWEWHAELKNYAEKIGLDCFSTPFDPTAVDFLEKLNVDVYKIASFEIIDLPLIRHIARTKKPVIMSTGMASLAEIHEAVATLKQNGCPEVALLKCTSAYPALASEMNLRTIPNLSETFNVPVGLSDHTLGIGVAVASVALGACIIEKHFTLDRKVPGPDSSFSLEPAEFRELVNSVRLTEQALGEVHYGTTSTEKQSRVFRRSLFAIQDIKSGETFTDANVRSIRPGDGLQPKYLDIVLGKKARQDIKRGTPISWELLI